jgi:hypothetical protein
LVGAGEDFSGTAANGAAARQSTIAPETSFNRALLLVRLRKRTKAGQRKPTGLLDETYLPPG